MVDGPMSTSVEADVDLVRGPDRDRGGASEGRECILGLEPSGSGRLADDDGRAEHAAAGDSQQ